MSVPATAVDAEYQETTALATRPAANPTSWVPQLAVSVAELEARVNAKREFMAKIMREGEHYGALPGTTVKDGEKPKKVLFKSGAELLLSSFGLATELADADAPTRDYGEDGREGMIVFRRVCRVYKQTGPAEHDRMKIAQAEGSASSREAKYRWRTSERVCPECGKPAIKKSKFEDSKGYYCFGKIGGCGAKFRLGDAAIEGQETGRVPNPDLADVENTILKMADKRAFVAAALIATGCSDVFTQDIVEDPEDPDAGAPPERPQEPENRPRSDESPPRVSKSTVDKIFAAFARIGADDNLESKLLAAATNGRVTDPLNVPYLTVPEAAALSPLIAAEEAKRPEPVQCPECTGLDNQHLDDDLGPCLNDHSPRAEAIRTGEASAERYPELHQESLL